MEIYVQVRLDVHTVFNTKLYMQPEETILLMKKKICESNENLDEKLLFAVFAGSVMEDSSTIKSFGFSKRAPIMVHMFKKNKKEQSVPSKPANQIDLIKLGLAFKTLSSHQSFKNELLKFRKIEAITKLIVLNPSLEDDPIAISFLQHPELLIKYTDFQMIKYIAENHPILATIILQIPSILKNEISQNNFGIENSVRPILNHGSDEEMDDMDDSSAASEDSTRAQASIGHGSITAAQLASAIASVRPHTQPSTSGASTSTGSTGNLLAALHNVQNQQTRIEMSIPTQLQIMRDMGLTNEALNLEAIRLSDDLETAIGLVLSGFTITDYSRNAI